MQIGLKSFLQQHLGFPEHRPKIIKKYSLLKKAFHRDKDDQPAQAAVPLLHARDARANARSQVERVISQAVHDNEEKQGLDHASRSTTEDLEEAKRLFPLAVDTRQHARSEAGKTLLRQPHLLGNILGSLPAPQQRALMSQVTAGSFGRSLGKSPRYDALHFLSDAQKTAFLLAPATAQAVLDEVLNEESEVTSALRMSALARHLPTRAMQVQALDFTSNKLKLFRRQPAAPAEFVSVLANVACVFRSPTTDAGAREFALAILRSHLPSVEGAGLGSILQHLSVQSENTTSHMRDTIIGMLEAHIDRVPASSLPRTLSSIAEMLAQKDASSRSDPRYLAQQARIAGLVRQHVQRIPEPKDRASTLISLARTDHVLPGQHSAFLELVRHALPHFSPRQAGELMLALSEDFVRKYGADGQAQAVVLAFLGQHLQHAGMHRDSVLNALAIEFDKADTVNLAPGIKEGIVSLIDRHLDDCTDAGRRHVVAMLGMTLGLGHVETPGLGQKIFEAIAPRIPADLDIHREHKEHFSQLVAAITLSMNRLDDSTQLQALDLIDSHLASMSPRWRTTVLSTLAKQIPESGSNKERAMRLIHVHLQANLNTAEAIPLCQELVSGNRLRRLAPEIQKQVADTLMDKLPSMNYADRQSTLHRLIGTLAPGVHSGIQDRALDMLQSYLDTPDLSHWTRGLFVEYLAAQLAKMDGEHAMRAIDLIEHHVRSIDRGRGGSLDKVLGSLAHSLKSPALSPQAKMEALGAITDNIRLLDEEALSQRARYSVVNIMSSLARGNQLHTALAEAILVALNDIISLCPNDRDMFRLLAAAFNNFSTNNAYLPRVRQMIHAYSERET